MFFLLASTSAAANPTLNQARAAMVRDPHEVITLIAKARREFAATGTSSASIDGARADWLEAEARGRLGQLELAHAISARGLAVVERLEPRSKLHGDLLMTQGGIALDENRVRDAFGLFQRAHTIFAKLGESRSQAITLQNIGTIYSFAGDQRSVLRYYAQAQEVHGGDAALAQAAANNLGTAYRELKDYERADAEFRRAVVLARELESPVLEARALNNLASVALLRGRPRDADRLADRGLRIAAQPESAEWSPFLWGVKAQAALARKDSARAITLFNRTFQGTDLGKTSFYFRDFHESAAEAYRDTGNLALAYAHLGALKRLDDEAREIRSSTNAALAAAQFDFSNQELRILKLREGQLARDIKIERARARQQLLLLLGTSALLIVTAIAFLFIRRSRNQTRAANRDLACTNVALDKALKAKSDFLATTSHEIRTPLNGILGMTQVLLGRRTLDPAVRDQVRIIDSAGSTMKAIVDDILDMSQIERGKVDVERVTIDLHALMADVAGLWRPAAEQKGLRFTVDLERAPTLVEEDDRKLRQICFNLLSNAVKFTRTGEVAFRVSGDPAQADPQLVVEVHDTGIGIAEADFAAIFEPFQQADTSTSREFGGTGLGLAISRKLVEALGGKITVTSMPGIGSTFTVVLPLRAIADSGATPAVKTLATCLTEASITVVEDNPLLASMIEACLVGAKSVTMVESVEDLSGRPDIVVVGEEVDSDAITGIRTMMPSVRIVMLGDAASATTVDAVVPRQMPPLGLGPAIDDLLTSHPCHAQAA